ncbi:hypothetical protein [Sporosarcina gallistercoris]|uniref:YopA central domain-containing protein n=1 Tax=Sporosarcina gallistercoris TaxID=2762245 RepID=A0ABR8PIQ7_9BACL|nr:hypothetical protein [Sporosarcina gallistercoris]MBD7908024.1 hypothetical protein [Sporosarcina gallistercoris]
MELDIPVTIADPKIINEKLLSSEIYNGEFNIRSGSGKSIDLKGTINYQVHPKPSVRFKGDVLKSNNVKNFDEHDWELTTKTCKEISGSFIITSVKYTNSKTNSRVEVNGELQYELKTSLDIKLTEVKFSLINFINNYGRAYKYENAIYAGRVELSFNQYNILIDKVTNSKEIYKKLKEQGGYDITHIGQIRRKDGKEFKLSDVDSLLENIAWILSFAAGRRVDLNHIYSDSGDYKMICYRLPDIKKWKYISNWYPTNSLESLENLLTCLLTLMKDEYWCKQLPRILSQYFDGFGSSYIDNKIIIIQAGLETIAWAYFVETTKELTRTKYESLRSAKNKIGKLLREFNIENITSGLSGLQEKNESSLSSLQKFTSLRNELVHPERNKKIIDREQLYFLWRLGIVYLELAILAVGKYEGDYLNMTINLDSKQERLQKVPWTV